MTVIDIITQTINYVKKELNGAEGGHDWFHIERVWNTSKLIASYETTANLVVVELAALLHDIADPKFHDGDENIGPQKARAWMESLAIDHTQINHVIDIIENISFSSGKSTLKHQSLELDIVQDADRLDAIGAIGIARAFNYGGYKNRELFNPNIEPNNALDKEQYRKNTAPTINHFYEKLILLAANLKTKKGRELGQERHRFLVDFLTHFFNEWYSKDMKNLPSSFKSIL